MGPGRRAEIDDAAAEPPPDYSFDLVTDSSRIRRELGYRERVVRAEALAITAAAAAG